MKSPLDWICYKPRLFSFTWALSTKRTEVMQRPLESKCLSFASALHFPFWQGWYIGCDQILCFPLYICATPSSFSQRLWLMSFMTFCGEDLFLDLILWKGQPEILKKLWPWQIILWVISFSQRKYYHPKAKAKSRPHPIAITLQKGRLSRIWV